MELKKETVGITVSVVSNAKERHGVGLDGAKCRFPWVLPVKRFRGRQIFHGHADLVRLVSFWRFHVFNQLMVHTRSPFVRPQVPQSESCPTSSCRSTTHS